MSSDRRKLGSGPETVGSPSFSTVLLQLLLFSQLFINSSSAWFSNLLHILSSSAPPGLSSSNIGNGSTTLLGRPNRSDSASGLIGVHPTKMNAWVRQLLYFPNYKSHIVFIVWPEYDLWSGLISNVINIFTIILHIYNLHIDNPAGAHEALLVVTYKMQLA